MALAVVMDEGMIELAPKRRGCGSAELQPHIPTICDAEAGRVFLFSVYLIQGVTDQSFSETKSPDTYVLDSVRYCLTLHGSGTGAVPRPRQASLIWRTRWPQNVSTITVLF